MPKGFTEDEKAAIRQRLLSEGYKQFSAYGLKRTTIESLAHAAKISTGAFYLFYTSKEALFMDAAELAEQRFRQELLAVVDLPGPSPRARLFAVFKTAFALLKTIPILQLFTSGDFDLLLQRMPQEQFQTHIANDRLFFAELIARCRDAGIPIQAQPDAIVTLLYPLIFAVLHELNVADPGFGQGADWLLELVAAFCLGEVDLQFKTRVSPTPLQPEGNLL